MNASTCDNCKLEAIGYDIDDPMRNVIFRCRRCGAQFRSDISRARWLEGAASGADFEITEAMRRADEQEAMHGPGGSGFFG